jgi:hypothetical protein
MSETVIKAKYIGHPDGVDLTIPYRDGDTVHVHVEYGKELPVEVQGRGLPQGFVKSLLEQESNWAEVPREMKDPPSEVKAAPKETK